MTTDAMARDAGDAAMPVDAKESQGQPTETRPGDRTDDDEAVALAEMHKDNGNALFRGTS